MKQLYRIFLLILTLTFLSTYSPKNFQILPEKDKTFFKIRSIEIINNNIIKEKEIYDKLEKIYEKNILFLKKSDLEKPLESFEFLDKIEVKKEYPDKIVIKIYERKAIAILYKKNSKFLIDNTSKLITFNDIYTNDLPGVFGEKAENNFMDFFNKLKNNNFPSKRIKNFYYFQIGRWDLQLYNDQIIKFPIEKTIEAIKQSIKLINRSDFKNYNIIDLRLNDKIVVE